MFLDKYDITINYGKIFQIMDQEGKIIDQKLMPKMHQDEIINVYKTMVLTRVYDDLAFQYQRQGRLLTFPPTKGQEAIGVAIGKVLNPHKDWYVSGYRDAATWITLGKPLRDIFTYWGGNERGSIVDSKINVTPVDVIIGTQYSHATGIALANKLLAKDSITITSIGDGGTSTGEFYSALNWAGVQKLPVIFIIQNNQFAISTPTRLQTSVKTLSQKAIGVGIRGFQVDGNDFFGSYVLLQKAIQTIKDGQGPILIEALTYRMGPHTTADDPTLYRTQEYHDRESQKDPLIRFKKYLMQAKLWDENQEKNLIQTSQAIVKKEFEASLKTLDVPIADIFEYTYSTLPPDLAIQQKELENYFAKKEVINVKTN